MCLSSPLAPSSGDLAIVLSGGGARAAYQVGAFKALESYLDLQAQPIATIIGSSIGAVNGVIFGACLKSGYSDAVTELSTLWRERTFRNSFAGSPSRSFLKAILVATAQWRSPGLTASEMAIFDPTPLMNRVDALIKGYGSLRPEERHPNLKNVAVMTTLEGPTREPLLFLSSHKKASSENMVGASFEICYVESITAKHAFASAALPSILPPVKISTEEGSLQLIDGGIAQNHPVDPAVRLGAERVILIDVSGRDWWFNLYGTAHDTAPDWEVKAEPDTYCLRPNDYFLSRCMTALGPILKEAVGRSTKRFISSVGPVWPLYTLLRKKCGEAVAYEVMSYVALDEEYINALIERGFHETTILLKKRAAQQCEEDLTTRQVC
jgi:predicted acylesterase/phospholipase RssA